MKTRVEILADRVPAAGTRPEILDITGDGHMLLGMVAPRNSLFTFAAKVRRGERCPMPANLAGAIVPCFAAAPDHLAAVRLAVGKLQSEGYIFEDLEGGEVHQLDPAGWTRYVQSTWPEAQDRLPSHAQVATLLTSGGAFFGPFLGWETDG